MKRKKALNKIMPGIVLGLFFCCHGMAEDAEKEIISKEKAINFGNYQIIINKHGKVVECKKDNAVILGKMGLMAYPADKSGRLFQGGNSNECSEKEIEATALSKENDSSFIRRKAILGNKEHPELMKYSQELIFHTDNTIDVTYEIEYMETIKWTYYGPTYPVIIPVKLISGRGWVAEMKRGETVKCGFNPEKYEKTNADKWVSIDDGSTLRMESEVGEIKIRAIMPSFLRGGCDGEATGICVISMPREVLIEKGTLQTIKFKIILP